MRWGVDFFLVFTVLAVGCGGHTRRGGDDDAGSDGGGGTTSVGGSSGLPDAEPDAEPDADASMDVVSDYVDPGCPDAMPPPPDIECDPLGTPTGCDEGLACYPYVDRPDGDCGFEQFGAHCLEPGSIGPGERCGSEFGWCGAGLLCVVGALPGARCLTLCDPHGPETCTGGLICSPVDIEGYGVCG